MQQNEREPLTLYLVKQLQTVARVLMDEALRPHGIGTLQYTALTVLRHRGSLSSAQLARRTFVTPQSMHEMVVSLERAGLVRRTRDESNRRVLLIELSEAGQRLLDTCDPLVGELEEAMLAGMNNGQRRDFRTALRNAYAGLAPLASRDLET